MKRPPGMSASNRREASERREAPWQGQGGVAPKSKNLLRRMGAEPPGTPVAEPLGRASLARALMAAHH